MADNGKLSYFLMGLGIGVGVGVLFAPRTGENTRQYIKAKADEGKDYVKRWTEDVRDSASTLVERGKEMVSKQKENVVGAVEAGKPYREAAGNSAEKGSAPHEA